MKRKTPYLRKFTLSMKSYASEAFSEVYLKKTKLLNEGSLKNRKRRKSPQLRSILKKRVPLVRSPSLALLPQPILLK